MPPSRPQMSATDGGRTAENMLTVSVPVSTSVKKRWPIGRVSRLDAEEAGSAGSATQRGSIPSRSFVGKPTRDVAESHPLKLCDGHDALEADRPRGCFPDRASIQPTHGDRSNQ